MSNHMKPCITCKFSETIWGAEMRCRHGKPRATDRTYDPVRGSVPIYFWAQPCRDRRGSGGDCRGDFHELTLWGRLKASIKRLFKRLLKYTCQ